MIVEVILCLLLLLCNNNKYMMILCNNISYCNIYYLIYIKFLRKKIIKFIFDLKTNKSKIIFHIFKIYFSSKKILARVSSPNIYILSFKYIFLFFGRIISILLFKANSILVFNITL